MLLAGGGLTGTGLASWVVYMWICGNASGPDVHGSMTKVVSTRTRVVRVDLEAASPSRKVKRHNRIPCDLCICKVQQDASNHVTPQTLSLPPTPPLQPTRGPCTRQCIRRLFGRCSEPKGGCQRTQPPRWPTLQRCSASTGRGAGSRGGLRGRGRRSSRTASRIRKGRGKLTVGSSCRGVGGGRQAVGL